MTLIPSAGSTHVIRHMGTKLRTRATFRGMSPMKPGFCGRGKPGWRRRLFANRAGASTAEPLSDAPIFRAPRPTRRFVKVLPFRASTGRARLPPSRDSNEGKRQERARCAKKCGGEWTDRRGAPHYPLSTIHCLHFLLGALGASSDLPVFELPPPRS